MSAKPINPILKQVLELGPTLAFFLLYIKIKDNTYTIMGTDYSGFIVAAVVFIPVLLAAMAVLWFLTKKLSRMQVFTAIMVIFFGGLTAWFNDEAFFKMKTSIVYGLFSLLLGIGLLRGQSWLEYVMGEFLPMQREGWMILTRRLTVFFAGLAAANEFIWRTQSEELWVTLETFAFPVVLFLFLWSQIVTLQRFLIEEPK
ncbi:MAG: septation protein A [Marivivens sp.]|jgi:intracellular septation protein|uniref:inner membrane-spanning protein YciB n=1 Tax=Marivivens sp. TaxID=1978374 RepID=UPI0025B9AAC5|nr:septation protein IspZ [Marivivens sp.]NBQ51060.1 septation protein A [Marivivens sp.]NBT52213.1 septation protein A [Marivivens sp.]NBX09912.1 septation protein A [Marivivens sp.]NDH03089.1 septation protein A [Marivivens sp.]